jgi:hypothetical protein
MSKPKLTPWFNAKKQPPVNGRDYAEYDWRCIHPIRGSYGPERRWKDSIIRVGWECPHCEWRGLAEPPKC